MTVNPKRIALANTPRECPVPGCGEATFEFMCPADWARVSAPTRRAFIIERRRLQELGWKKLSPYARELVARCLGEALEVRRETGLPTAHAPVDQVPK